MPSNSSEKVSVNQDRIVQQSSLLSSTESRAPHTNKTREYKYVTYKKALENLRKPSESHLNDKYFLDENDEQTKKFIDSIREEISHYAVDNSIEGVKLRGRKEKSFAAWVYLKEDKKELRIDKSFLGGVCTSSDPKVTAVTIVSQEDKRLLRISRDDKGIRLYEVINGSSIITFNWKVGNKDCSITVDISVYNEKRNKPETSVICSNRSEGLTLQDLAKNTAVKIRLGYIKGKDMTLAELVALDKSQDKSSSEETQVDNKPSTNVANTETTQVDKTKQPPISN
ncbi:MAG: hypothetical protein LJD31_04160 [Wolbachia endosymbiont of Menacanthus eurysternus]|nr:hypothetical protein [Wolbachia endosymbiont of Menacanthus eurysternus]